MNILRPSPKSTVFYFLKCNPNLMQKQRQAFFIQRRQALGPCFWNEAGRTILLCSRKIWWRKSTACQNRSAARGHRI